MRRAKRPRDKEIVSLSGRSMRTSRMLAWNTANIAGAPNRPMCVHELSSTPTRMMSVGPILRTTRTQFPSVIAKLEQYSSL